MRESESPFAFYFVLLFHTFGLALLVGANAVVDLRLLGIEREIPLTPLKRLFGIMWAGFAINAASGVLLLIAYPRSEERRVGKECRSRMWGDVCMKRVARI